MTQLTNFWRFVVIIALLSVPAWNTRGQETESPSDETESTEVKNENGQQEKDKKDVELTGVFEAVRAAPISINPEEWTTLTVDEAVEHGEEVVKGDILIKLDTEKIDDAISDAEDALETEELNLETAQIKFNLARQNQEMSLTAAEKADRVATEELKEFIAQGRDRSIQNYARTVKSARERLEYQEEELKQLERMYEADDLTEETEEIILKRTRNDVDDAKYYVDNALNSQRKGLKYTVPRTEEDLKTAIKKAALALEEAQRTAPLTLKLQELALAKQKLALERNQEKLKRLRADRQLLTIRAPRAGIVYYGAAKRGKWSDPSAIDAMLVPGGTLKSKSVIMTVVQPNPLNVRVSIPEASRRYVQPGTPLSVTAIAFPDAELKGRVQSVSAIPVNDGVFDAVISVRLGELRGKIVPGMKAKIKIAAGKKGDDEDDEVGDDEEDEEESADEDDVEA